MEQQLTDPCRQIDPKVRLDLRSPGTMVGMPSMTKGSNLPVTAGSVRAVLSWTSGAGIPDVDASALLLGDNGKVNTDDDFVFYNQPHHPCGHVRHEPKKPSGSGFTESVSVGLADLDPSIDRVLIAASADGGTFGQVPNLVLNLSDAAGASLATFEIADATTETAFVFGELYRRAGGWKFRAIGQGYASGLKGLATDFGITVEDDAPPAPPPAPPAATLAPNPPAATTPSTQSESREKATPGEDRLPVDMRKRLSLRKQQVAISLVKAGAPTLTARVVLVLDASGSMSRLYSTGVVTGTVERMAAVAAQLDEDGSMQAWTFATHPGRLPDLELAGLPEWLDLHVRVGSMFKQKPKKLRPGQLDMGKVGVGNEEQKVIAEVRDYVRTNPLSVPTLVLFFSDGGVYRNREIEKQLREAVEEPIFWQFVGLGSAKFGILEEFDTLTGRRVDNVGFFKVKDIAQVADADLYDQLLSEFPQWIRAAGAAGILR